PFGVPPIAASLLLTTLSAPGVRVAVWRQEGPRLLVRVCPPIAKWHQLVTRILVFTTEDHFELALLCDHEKALLWINGEPAGSRGYPLPDVSPLHVRLPAWAENQDIACQEWCATATSEAIERRKRRRLSLKA